MNSPSTPPAGPLPGFEPLEALSEGEGAPYPSEQSLQWALRRHRMALIEEQAVALYRGRVYVRRDVFLSVVSRTAIEAYRKRYAEAA